MSAEGGNGQPWNEEGEDARPKNFTSRRHVRLKEQLASIQWPRLSFEIVPQDVSLNCFYPCHRDIEKIWIALRPIA